MFGSDMARTRVEPRAGKGKPMSVCRLFSPTPAPGGGRERIAFEIGEDIRLFLSPSNIQINSPDHIEDALLQPFRTKHKPILLLSPHNSKVMSATLHTVERTYLMAELEHSTFMRKPGEMLLVVFPVLPQRHYVLQTTVEAVYFGQLKLQYQDPRYDRRWSMPLAIPVTVQGAPMEIMIALAHRQGHLVREMTLAPSQPNGTRQGDLADRLYESDALESCLAMGGGDASPPLTGSLKDLSLGGACVTLADLPQPDELLQRVILLRMTLPRIPLDTTSLQLMLQPLGIVRNVRTTVSPATLHIRFLQRLPKEMEPLFEALCT